MNLKTRVVNLIKKSPQKSLTIKEIQKKLTLQNQQISEATLKSTLRKIVELDRARKHNGESPKYSIEPNKGGQSFRYTGGGETTRKGTGPYRDIIRVLDSDSVNVLKIFEAAHLNSFDVHGGKSARGQWGRPDVVVALYRKLGSARPFSIHSLEFEGRGGFSPANIAQAYFSGQGANKCWLLFDARDWPKTKRERIENPNAERIRNLARLLGVGLISYRNLGRSNDWKLIEPAKNQKYDKDLRESLRTLFEGELKTKSLRNRT